MPSLRLQSVLRNRQRDFTYAPSLPDDQLIAIFEVEIGGVYGEIRLPVDEQPGHWSDTWFEAEKLAKNALHRLAVS